MDLVIVAVIVAVLARWGVGLDPHSVVVVTVLVVLAWSAFAAVWWPFVPCPAPFCDRGKVRRPGKRKAYRRCGWCHGRGERTRWFRRFYDEVRPTKHRRR